MFPMFNTMFGLFFVMFLLVFGMTLFRGFSQWNKNNHSPRLTVAAQVVARRSYTTHHHQMAGEVHHSHPTTDYYATFQFESGDRLELTVPAGEYGYLVEGDRGQLTFQGTRFLNFERT